MPLQDSGTRPGPPLRRARRARRSCRRRRRSGVGGCARGAHGTGARDRKRIPSTFNI
ncbi:hypothetical protein HMPREF0724_14606 [Prescottella equi ATCC 33707]|uniref:Uncharacterized protein n=1 Tax=Prescottella equi ATCC 33707 TaxID=525370 RepID=E9T750_RHOHA|nr:hypothetical protein HMPREF0724_14606 [Prescottella equi ATCC 33707]